MHALKKHVLPLFERPRGRGNDSAAPAADAGAVGLAMTVGVVMITGDIGTGLTGGGGGGSGSTTAAADDNSGDVGGDCSESGESGMAGSSASSGVVGGAAELPACTVDCSSADPPSEAASSMTVTLGSWLAVYAGATRTDWRSRSMVCDG